MPGMQEDVQATMVRYEAEDKVGIITLDRADKLNAINAVMKDQIIAAFARADKEPATSVIVLRANGRSFSAGFDLGHSPDRGKRQRRGRSQHLGCDAASQPRLRHGAMVDDQTGDRFGAGARAGWRLRAHLDVRSHDRSGRRQVRRAGGAASRISARSW